MRDADGREVLLYACVYTVRNTGGTLQAPAPTGLQRPAPGSQRGGNLTNSAQSIVNNYFYLIYLLYTRARNHCET